MLMFIGVIGYFTMYYRNKCTKQMNKTNDCMTEEMKLAIAKAQLKQFTLVEVTMSIAVIAIGMMGIMALFPIGFQASRNAIGDNYSSDLADQFLNVVAMQCKQYKIGVKDGWGEWITGDANTGWTNYNSSINNIDTKPSDTALDSANVIKGNMVFGDIDNNGYDDAGLYFDNDTPGAFYVEAKSGNITDFEGVIALWTEPIEYDVGQFITHDGTVSGEHTIATRLCLEISWPKSIPYSRREKRNYVLEVFNPNSR